MSKKEKEDSSKWRFLFFFASFTTLFMKGGTLPMDEYKEGCKNFRDIIIATIIGLQNETRDKQTYDAYQKLLEFIIQTYGGLYQDFKE